MHALKLPYHQNHTIIVISFDPQPWYRGHSGRVRGLEWSYNDQLLVSCGGDGAVYQWKLKHFKRAKENVLKARMHARQSHGSRSSVA